MLGLSPESAESAFLTSPRGSCYSCWEDHILGITDVRLLHLRLLSQGEVSIQVWFPCLLISFLFFFSKFLTTPCSMWDPSSQLGIEPTPPALESRALTTGLPGKSLFFLFSFFPSLSLCICENEAVQLSSVAQACPTLCDPMNRSTPGFPVHHQLPECTQTHIH